MFRAKQQFLEQFRILQERTNKIAELKIRKIKVPQEEIDACKQLSYVLNNKFQLISNEFSQQEQMDIQNILYSIRKYTSHYENIIKLSVYDKKKITINMGLIIIETFCPNY